MEQLRVHINLLLSFPSASLMRKTYFSLFDTGRKAYPTTEQGMSMEVSHEISFALSIPLSSP